jgi:hypothetical protein
MLTCEDAAAFVSVIHDGETVPKLVAEHIAKCTTCRELLHEYSQIGAEMRLLASRTSEEGVPRDLLAQIRSSKRSFWSGLLQAKLLVPRFAAILVGIGIVGLSASLMVLRAQGSRPLWFQFGLYQNDLPSDGRASGQYIAQAGYDEGMVLWGAFDEIDSVHIEVSEIKEGSIKLAVRAKRYPKGDTRMFDAKKELGDLGKRTVQYVPGEPLQIPVEGGGTLVLKGYVADHQPKLAWHMPVELNPNQLVLTSPVLISGDQVLAEYSGFAGIAEGEDEGLEVGVHSLGGLAIGLHQFPGAVQGKANWGRLTFQLNGTSYTLLSGSPITGGDQPRTVWIGLNPARNADDLANGLGAGTIRLPSAN